MSLDIRDVRYSDYGFLCEAFAQSNARHIEMRDDLYREVNQVMPKYLFNALVSLKHVGLKKDVCVRIAEQGDQPVGAVFAVSEARSSLSWSKFPKEVSLDNIIVIPEYRQTGIGTALLQAAKAWAKDTGHEYMHAKILKQNDASLRLFKKAGLSVDSHNVGCHL